MRILAFRHSPSDGLGLLEDILQDHGFVYEYADPYHSPAADPVVHEADALIFLGGAMSANDDLPFLHRESQYIKNALLDRQPLLGICLGAQLIAKALGASVRPSIGKEIGWAPVTFNKEGQCDPIFHGLNAETIFHWHGEMFDVPKSAELLAFSAGCPHQAFRCGDKIYGLQFHLEVTPAMIAQWCHEDDACGESRESRGPIDPYAYASRAAELAQLVFGRWCELVRCNARSD